MEQNCPSFSGWSMRLSLKMFEYFCCRAWEIRPGLSLQKVKMGRGQCGYSSDASKWDSLSSIHRVPVGAELMQAALDSGRLFDK